LPETPLQSIVRQIYVRMHPDQLSRIEPQNRERFRECGFEVGEAFVDEKISPWKRLMPVSDQAKLLSRFAQEDRSLELIQIVSLRLKTDRQLLGQFSGVQPQFCHWPSESVLRFAYRNLLDGWENGSGHITSGFSKCVS
jgi:hypothetical protein